MEKSYFSLEKTESGDLYLIIADKTLMEKDEDISIQENVTIRLYLEENHDIKSEGILNIMI